MKIYFIQVSLLLLGIFSTLPHHNELHDHKEEHARGFQNSSSIGATGISGFSGFSGFAPTGATGATGMSGFSGF